MSVLLFTFAVAASAQEAEPVRGVDVSWCTEIENDGMKFYDRNGTETELLKLMKDIGMNAVRLRVWVDPENPNAIPEGEDGYTAGAYGPWCNKADVLVKARRAHAQGMDLMIDFHYSDFFTDPSKQAKPAAWKDLSFEDLKKAVATHTKDVLQTLKDEGIEPKWVQVGNETTGGMLWPDGSIDWNKAEDQRWLNYVALSNAGYDAVKEVLPSAYVIVHHDNAKYDNLWFYQAFQRYGGKFDMVGLSHYPSWNNPDENKDDNWSRDNTNAATDVTKLHRNLNVPVMIVEYGYSSWDEERALKVVNDYFSKVAKADGYAGIFYWEPETYGDWSHGHPGTYGYRIGSHGAFNEYGQPQKSLLAIGGTLNTAGIATAEIDSDAPVVYYNQLGQRVDASAHGLIIMKQGNRTKKIIR